VTAAPGAAARRSALVLALATGLAAPAARADDEFVAKTQIYVDSDHTTVISPLVRAAKDVWRGGTIGAGFVADVVSSASIDVISNATTHMSDFRREVSGVLTQKLHDTTFGGSYIYSTENDYASHNFHTSVTQDLAQKNVTLSLGYSLSLNDVGRSGDPGFHRALDVHNLDVVLGVVLTQKTIVQASYTFGYSSGYMASPYRYVHIEASPDFKVPETDPSERLRHAFVIAANRHLGADSSLEGDYRLYLDDWGVVSHTVQLRYLVNVGPVTLRLRERFYYQSGASFFQSHYVNPVVPAYVTADRELSTFWSDVAGLKVTYHLPRVLQGLSLEAKVDVFYFSYLDFAYLVNRYGADLEAGLAFNY
jgi:hypothetical protein